ncbi:head-tail connector protein [Sphingomonas sp. RIT328]|uniref:head-tail connector protein n=1 Tax=Sphingomonas sp. RIT328 TaxID=1470591 RepID=UPI0004464E47|nr:head-tail connector protein [Sphingomonas sp. RIT328]EZP57434.1 hypothetical protein BW41_00279 [Sphingomonas sp. RIT328]
MNPRVIVIEPPQPIITLDEAKQQLKVDADDDDALIEAYIAAATGHIDGPDGWLGRAIGVQTLEAGLDGFVHDPIRLPYPPLIDLVSIRYEDVTGTWRDLDPATYEVRDGEIGTAWGKSWPGTRSYRGASRSVRIRYRAGYEQVPAPLRVALLMFVDDLYRNRGNVAIGNVGEIKMPMASSMLLQPFRVYG